MAYFHLLLSFDDKPQAIRCMLADASEKELRRRFVTPYRRGKNCLCGGEVVAVSRIRSVQIIRTSDTSENELKKIRAKSSMELEELNRSSRGRGRGLVFLGIGLGQNLEDISYGGEDVTTEFIHGPPGHGDRWTIVAAVLNNPWISTIATGLIVAALLWWFGLN